MIVGFILAAQGAVAVSMSYFPELFGSRYRYAGVTLGREFAAVIGGGFAPLIAVALMSATGSWVPVAVYMTVAMAISLIAALKCPETLNRDLTVEETPPIRTPPPRRATWPDPPREPDAGPPSWAGVRRVGWARRQSTGVSPAFSSSA